MRYEMLSIEPHGKDDIVTLCQKPNQFERLFGRHEEQQLTAYGHAEMWWTMDGQEVSGRLRRFLQRISQQRPRSTLQTAERAQRQVDPIDEAGDESFPASDPPCWTKTKA